MIVNSSMATSDKTDEDDVMFVGEKVVVPPSVNGSNIRNNRLSDSVSELKNQIDVLKLQETNLTAMNKLLLKQKEEAERSIKEKDEQREQTLAKLGRANRKAEHFEEHVNLSRDSNQQFRMIDDLKKQLAKANKEKAKANKEKDEAKEHEAKMK